MEPTTEAEVSEYQPIIDDIVRLAHKVRTRRWDSVQEAKKEFSEEAYPLMETIVRALVDLDDRVSACEDATGLADSVIMPELGAQILGTLEVGGQLARAVLDGASQEDCAAIAAQYMELMEPAVHAIVESVVDDEEDEEDDDDDEEEQQAPGADLKAVE